MQRVGFHLGWTGKQVKEEDMQTSGEGASAGFSQHRAMKGRKSEPRSRANGELVAM